MHCSACTSAVERSVRCDRAACTSICHDHYLSLAAVPCAAAHRDEHGCRELPGVVSATVALLSNSAEVRAS